jgi:hypothetical protein
MHKVGIGMENLMVDHVNVVNFKLGRFVAKLEICG